MGIQVCLLVLSGTPALGFTACIVVSVACLPLVMSHILVLSGKPASGYESHLGIKRQACLGLRVTFWY